jgi:hypothetical protein
MNDSSNLDISQNKIELKTNNTQNEDNKSINVVQLNDKKKFDFNEDVCNKSTEEFWEDAKNVSRSKLTDEACKNKEDFSLSLSKKIKYDNSLSKIVDFDDLIASGKIKNESEFTNLNMDYLESQTYNNCIVSEPNVSIVKKVSDKSIGQISVNITQPSTSIKDSNSNNKKPEIYVIKKIGNGNNNVKEKISNKNTISDKIQPRSNIKVASVSPGKNMNKVSVGISNMRSNTITPSKTNKRNISVEDNKRKIKSAIKPNLKTNLIVTNKNSDKKENSIQSSFLNNKKSNSTKINNKPDVKKETSMKTNRNNNSVTPKSKSSGLSRLNSLYRKGKEKDEKIKKQGKEAEEIRKANELNACTFKPKINNNFNSAQKTVVTSRQIPMYERQQMWNNKKIEKYLHFHYYIFRIEKEKNITQENQNNICTFAPTIIKNKNIDYGQPKNDKPTKKFLERVDKAKKLKEDANNKLNPNYSNHYLKFD